MNRNIHRVVFGAATCLFAACGLARTTTPLLPPANVVPSRTGVLLLPPVDTEPWAKDVLAQRQFVVRRRVQYEFLSRHFKTYGETMALRAAGRHPAIDLADPAARTAANMDVLAKRTGADWVVSVDVQEVKDDPGHATDDFHCHCRVVLKIWDASRHGWIANGPYVGHDRHESSLPVFLFMESIDEAAKGAVLAVVGRYPTVVHLADISQVYDYLSGQTKPFTGDPEHPFLGLKTK